MFKVIFAGLLALGTVGAWTGSALGWGLTGMMNKPVSIRQESAQRGSRSGRGGLYLLYFGTMGRSHYGGGYRGGK